jgi:hypothetical protein
VGISPIKRAVAPDWGSPQTGTPPIPTPRQFRFCIAAFWQVSGFLYELNHTSSLSRPELSSGELAPLDSFRSSEHANDSLHKCALLFAPGATPWHLPRCILSYLEISRDSGSGVCREAKQQKKGPGRQANRSNPGQPRSPTHPPRSDPCPSISQKRPVTPRSPTSPAHHYPTSGARLY